MRTGMDRVTDRTSVVLVIFTFRLVQWQDKFETDTDNPILSFRTFLEQSEKIRRSRTIYYPKQYKRDDVSTNRRKKVKSSVHVHEQRGRGRNSRSMVNK